MTERTDGHFSEPDAADGRAAGEAYAADADHAAAPAAPAHLRQPPELRWAQEPCGCGGHGEAEASCRPDPHAGATEATPPHRHTRSSSAGHDAWAAPRSAGTPAEAHPLGAKRLWPRSFADRLTDPLPGVRAFARVARESALRPRPSALRDELPKLPYAPAPLPEAGPRALVAGWAGHASWVLRIGGLTVLTDPVWSRRILGTPARVTPVGFAWEDLPPIDAVVLSHNHYDHLDAPTLRRLPRHTPLFVPAGLGAWCRRRGFSVVTELDWWEGAELPAAEDATLPGERPRVRFDFVPAHHWSKRSLADTCRSLWGGWVLTAPDGLRVYFAGDTGYGRAFAEIGSAYDHIDLALLPIGAYDPRWMLRPVHTDPEEAVQACLDVGARRMAPMHWSTFLLSAEPPLEPLTRVRVAWRAAGRDREDLWDLPVGASRVLEPAREHAGAPDSAADEGSSGARA